MTNNQSWASSFFDGASDFLSDGIGTYIQYKEFQTENKIKEAEAEEKRKAKVKFEQNDTNRLTGAGVTKTQLIQGIDNKTLLLGGGVGLIALLVILK